MGDSDWKSVIAGAIVGAIIGAMALGVITYYVTVKISQDQQAIEQQNIAQTLYFDVGTINARLITDLDQINKSPNNTIYFSTTPYYTSNGVYFVFSKDITNFKDFQLSSDLYTFYNQVMEIESERSYLEQISNENFMTGERVNLQWPIESEIISMNSDMYENMILASRNARKITTELIHDYPLSQPASTKNSATYDSFDLYNVSVRNIPSDL
ncbi:hypothetical protein [Methanoregula sp.]|uniref:hypothetical protein n=1 Tax=Methanoregula sp. TaxID=2052170 RepID=UPI002CC6AB67|nr:hypothetical protein [Methanoregula sp.]HVP96398.1 hypothetical protein [Methanoregula sp.]